ncbi:hypothetical protein N658DRAFT_237157 [Parathielavia hyrcaniae]|uniref:Uncharacterized protein n=1 Tax=Parathielavia hyrcaniae TaxID=113614 RepID=A0AAN6Q5M7_9PEZI|nr:hypothetical protein N658DRAFT_237157 [Parathielavia hyrcaniae]
MVKRWRYARRAPYFTRVISHLHFALFVSRFLVFHLCRSERHFDDEQQLDETVHLTESRRYCGCHGSGSSSFGQVTRLPLPRAPGEGQRCTRAVAQRRLIPEKLRTEHREFQNKVTTERLANAISQFLRVCSARATALLTWTIALLPSLITGPRIACFHR